MEGKNITKQINQQYKEVFNLRVEMNKFPKYSFQWFEVRDKYAEAFKELETLENKKPKGGFKMSEALNQNNGTPKKSSRAKNEVLEDAGSVSMEKLSKAISTTVNQIAEKELGKDDSPTTSPKILKKKKAKKTKEQKTASRKENGAKRLEKKANAIRENAKVHGSEIKRVWKKNQKRQEVCKAMEKHGITESGCYQLMNFLKIISTKGAQAKLKKMGLI